VYLLHITQHIIYKHKTRALVRIWCCASESDRANNCDFISIRFVDISSFSACTTTRANLAAVAVKYDTLAVAPTKSTA